MEILFAVVLTASNILCFLVGAKTGQKVSKGEEIKLPNPAETYRETQEMREAKKKQAEFDTILRNIDNYDGTPYGQEDVPGR
jgi:hypothetical protein